MRRPTNQFPHQAQPACAHSRNSPPFPFHAYWEIDLHGIPSYPMARAFVDAVLSDPGKSGLICIVYGKGKTNTANRGKMRAEVMSLLEKKRPFSLWPKGPFEAGYVWLEKPV